MGVLSSWDDPFTVVGKIPAGLAYQWCAISIMGDYTVAAPYLSEMERNGWAPVPWKRHKKMKRDRQWIVVQGQLLMQKPKHLVKEAETNRIKLSKRWAERHEDGTPKFLNTPSIPQRPNAPPRIPLDEAREKLKSWNGRAYAEFSTPMGMTITDSEVETACCLGLDVLEYARRKFIMTADVLRRVSVPDGGKTTPVFETVTLKTEWPHDRT